MFRPTVPPWVAASATMNACRRVLRNLATTTFVIWPPLRITWYSREIDVGAHSRADENSPRTGKSHTILGFRSARFSARSRSPLGIDTLYGRRARVLDFHRIISAVELPAIQDAIRESVTKSGFVELVKPGPRGMWGWSRAELLSIVCCTNRRAGEASRGC